MNECTVSGHRVGAWGCELRACPCTTALSRSSTHLSKNSSSAALRAASSAACSLLTGAVWRRAIRPLLDLASSQMPFLDTGIQRLPRRRASSCNGGHGGCETTATQPHSHTATVKRSAQGHAYRACILSGLGSGCSGLLLPLLRLLPHVLDARLCAPQRQYRCHAECDTTRVCTQLRRP